MTLNRFSWLCLAAFGVVVAWSACTKATVVGNDLLEDEIRFVGYTDTFRLLTTVRTEDSIITHSSTGGSQIIDHTFGTMDDQYFGRTDVVVISEMFLNGIGSEFLDFQVDSVVMTLALDSAGRYGDLEAPIRVSATKNFTTLDVTEDYYSNQRFTKNFVPMGETEPFVPNYVDNVVIEGPTDTISLEPHVRIPMSQDFINDLTSQSRATFEFSDSFAAWFGGVQIEVSEGNNTMVGIELNDNLSGMTVYYSNPDSGFYDDYSFVFTGLFNSHVQVATFDHDYTGSVSEAYIDNQEASDSLIFIQSLSGLNTEFEVRNLDIFEDVLINQAVLEFFVADLGEEDDMLYPRINRIQTRTLNDEGRLVNSIDVRLAFGVASIDLFGGTVFTDSQGRLKYSMNITAGVQDIVQGRAENKIFLSSYLKQNNPRRLVLYGPGHPEFPAKLSLTFTRT